MKNLLKRFVFTFITVAAVSCGAQQELGKVKWGRDLEKALANSKASGKPVFLLFQEVPG